MPVFPVGVYPPLPATKWILELNPAGGAKYRIRDVEAVPEIVYTVDSRYGSNLNDTSALADVMRRARKYRNDGPQAIEIGPGCTFNSTKIGVDDTNKVNVGWWAPSPSSPVLTGFEPLRDLHFYARDPVAGRPLVKQFTVGARFKNNVGGVGFLNDTNGKTLGPFSWRGFDFTNDGFNYCWNTQLGRNNVFDLFAFYDCQFIGTPGSFFGNGQGVSFDMLMAVRAAYAKWDIRDCVCVGAPREHVFYFDAVQGDSIIANCVTTPGLAGADGPGRTFCQIVQRAREDGNQNGLFHGSNVHFGKGTLWVTDNVCTGCGFSGAHTYTFVGHLGEIMFIGNRALQCNNGGVLFWADSGKGLHTTAGLFLFPPWPIAGTAFNYGRVVVEDFTMTQAVPWLAPTSPCRAAGIQQLEIGAFDVDVPAGTNRPTWSFWEHNTSGNAIDPLDNGDVFFLSGSIGNSVANWPGWNPGAARKATYGSTSNNNQPASGASITNPLLDAMLDTAPTPGYPPWFQAGPGSVDPNSVSPFPVAFTYVAPVVDTVTAGAPEITVTPEPLTFAAAQPDVGVAAEVVVSPDFVRFAVRMRDVDGVDVPALVAPSPLAFGLALFPVDIAGGDVVIVDVSNRFALRLRNVDDVVVPVIVTPDPLTFDLAVPDPAAVAAEGVVAPSPIVFTRGYPDPAGVDVPAVVTLSRPVGAFRLRLPTVGVDGAATLDPEPIVFAFSGAQPPAVLAEAVVTPDPLVAELIVPEAIGGEFLQPSPTVLVFLLPNVSGDVIDAAELSIPLPWTRILETNMAALPSFQVDSLVRFVAIFTIPPGDPLSGTPDPSIALADAWSIELTPTFPGGSVEVVAAALLTDGSDGAIVADHRVTQAGTWQIQGLATTTGQPSPQRTAVRQIQALANPTPPSS